MAEEWLFCAAASCFASLGVLLRTTVRPGVPEPRRDLGPGLLLGAAGLMLLAAFLGTRLPSFAVTGSASALAVVLLMAVRFLGPMSASRVSPAPPGWPGRAGGS